MSHRELEIDGCSQRYLSVHQYAFKTVPRISTALSGTIGTGEKAVFSAFAEARKHAPCIVFIDEFQVLTIEN